MKYVVKGALVGAIALAGLAAASSESSAMPVGAMAPIVSAADGSHATVDKVYWRYGWGWRRPFYRPWGWGWRRPFYRPWGWGYRPWRYRYYRW